MDFHYGKTVQDGYIVAIFQNTFSFEDEITEEEYNTIMDVINARPERDGYSYVLREDLTWEEVEIIEEEIDETEDELKERYLTEILESISIAQKPPKKFGSKIVTHYDADNHRIIYEYVADGSVAQSGNYLSPTAWESGMYVFAGTGNYESDGWYVYDGLVQRCIKDGAPLTFDDTEFWEVI